MYEICYLEFATRLFAQRDLFPFYFSSFFRSYDSVTQCTDVSTAAIALVISFPHDGNPECRQVAPFGQYRICENKICSLRRSQLLDRFGKVGGKQGLPRAERGHCTATPPLPEKDRRLPSVAYKMTPISLSPKRLTSSTQHRQHNYRSRQHVYSY